MAVTTITGRAAVLAGNLNGSVVTVVDDANGNTRKMTLAQLRTNLFAGGAGYATNDPLVVGGTIGITTNATYYQGKTTAGVIVDILGLTANTNSITRMAAATDAGGFDWTNSAKSIQLMTLIGGVLTVASGLTVSAGGITVNSGISSFQATTVTGVNSLAPGTVLVPTGTATTLLTLGSPATVGESYLVSYGGSGFGASGSAMIANQNGAWTITQQSAVGSGACVLSMSGNNVQLTQTTGGSQNVVARALHIS